MDLARSDLKACGLGLCAISYDSVDILHEFTERRGIAIPLLADPDSSIIRRFGLFNEGVEPESRDYGMAHPAIFLVDAVGVVRERFVEPRFYHRVTIPSILWRLGEAIAVEQSLLQRDHVVVRTAAPQTAVHPGNRITLIVAVAPAPGVHVYGPDVGEGYQGLAMVLDPQPWLTVSPPRYPVARRLTLPWTDEVLVGYAEPVEVEIDAALGTRQELAPLLEAGAGINLTGTCHLQPCDDQVCWPPEAVGVAWHFDLIPPDLTRASEPRQHRAKS